jgi:signal transduction histidine kinase
LFIPDHAFHCRIVINMPVLTKTDQLRDELIDILSQDEVDYGKIQSLSTELVNLDPEFVRFSADAALISRLGRELVARQETAVSELVKNAYDADATEVNLLFVETDEPGGRLEVVDNGLGMTREQLINGFMRLSSSEKILEPFSPRYNRQRAGRKGIGRFAVQRLGKKLIITTQTKNASKALRVTIHWSEFEIGHELSSVTSRIEEIPKQQEEGTRLTIDGLRDAWDIFAIRRMYRYISDLTQPFPISSRDASKHYDPGFKVEFTRESYGKFESIADEQNQIFQYALAEVSAYVDGKGYGFRSLLSEKLDLDEQNRAVSKDREKDNTPFELLRGIHFKAYYFIYEPDLIPRSQKKLIQDLAKEKGGIRVYRNGFRVPPYGDRDDDWLGLDALSKSRTVLPPIANNNFFGFVEIRDLEGTHFEETSSREGLLDNLAFQELQDFVLKVLKETVLRVADARGKKRTASQRGYESGFVITKALKTIDKMSKDLVQAGQSEQAKQLKAVSKQLKMASGVQEKQTQAILEELSMLRVLASLGLTIGEFTHEVSQTLGAASLASSQLLDKLKDSEEQEIARDVVYNVQRFKAYASYFAKAVSDNVSRELRPQDLTQIAREFIETVKPSAQRSGICVEELEITGDNLLTKPMHPSEWSSILFNFYTNARKAIRRAGSQGKIYLEVGQDGDKVYFEFADNGDGISPENSERIFNAFFTTTSAAGRNSSDYDDLQGTGLGLKIVNDIVASYSGRVFITTPPNGYTTCLRVEIPKATGDEVNNEH